MDLPSLPVSLKRGVGRRILGFFILAGLLPVIFTAGLAYNEISRGLQQDVNKTLRASAKDYALGFLARLQRTSEAADQIVTIIEQHGVADVAQHQYLLNGIDAIWFVRDSALPDVVHGDAALISELDDLAANETLPLLVASIGASGGELVLLRTVANGPSQGSVIAFKPEPMDLWGTSEDISYATDFCVFTLAGDRLHCTQEMDSGIHALVADTSSRRSLVPTQWQLEGEDQLASIWQLFLAGEFAAPALDIIASQPSDYALRSRADFSRVFVPALGLVIILVGLLSFNMIGQSLVPLQQLTLAVRQIASGNLLSRVRIRSDDEFEWLGEAFNNMAVRLGRQISTLEAMSGIDRLILSGAKFEEVSECVINHLVDLTGCDAGGVIARDTDTPHWAKLISSDSQGFVHERISLPMELGHHWCQPRQVFLEETSSTVAPYKERFQSYGLKYVVLIPIVLNDDLKGLLLLGSSARVNMETDNLQRCIDLAGRFAVALSSAEREVALYRQAHFDELTGLPNRQLLKDRLEQQIVHARRDEFEGALLFLDLDRFKEINDVYGHSVGDVVLIQAAERIVGEVRDSDTVARLGGDEFVVVLPHVSGDSRVRATAARLITRLTESFSVRGTDHFVSASIGIVMFPDDGDSVETLLRNADAAMYRAKEAGRARFEFFSKKLNAESRRKIGLERDLRAAYYNNDLEVYYQPQFDFATGIISGAEALLRWKHGDEGFISPAEFVPLAEDSDLIVDIGRWVIEQTCRDLNSILKKGLHPGIVSINVSARQLREQSFISDVLEPLQRYSIHPGYMQLEVTETTVAQSRDTAADLLTQLRKEGVHVAIDDFGTGYSSLSYLQKMPFDVIKIDKSFVDRIGAGDPSDNICRTIIKMAHELGKQSIAEGVEMRNQVEFLKANGCDFAQGFFYSEPLTNKDFVEFIEKQDFHTQRRKALEIVKA